MSNLFKHTVQPLGSTTSPVEDLAMEVAEAFDKISSTYTSEPNLITTFRESLGDFSMEDMQPHKTVKSFSEVHNITSRESSFLTKASPEDGSLSISYVNDNGETKVLTQVGANAPFTEIDQFRVLGKHVKLNLDVPKGQSVALGVSYRGETYSLGGRKFLPNVFKKQDGTFKLQATEVSQDSYEIQYDKNINDFIEEFKISSGSAITLFSTEDGTEWFKIDVDNYSVEEDKVKFTSSSFINSPTTYVVAYVNNVSVGDVLNALYKEFVEHQHGDNELTQNVNSYSLSNRVVNNEKISYKDDNIVNYQFPQYFNREGHNPNLDEVYENAILGNVFIARELTEGSGKYKGLDKDSNSIIFGDASTGPRFKYSREHRSTLLQNIDNINGLKITTPDTSKWALSLNTSDFYSDDTQGLKINPQANLVDITSPDPDVENVVKVDAIVVGKNASMHNVRVNSFKINSVHFKEHDNKVDAEIVPESNALGKAPELFIRMPLNVKSFTTEQFNIDHGDFRALDIGKVTLAKDTEDNLEITSEDDKIVKVIARAEFDNADFDNLSFNSIVFSKEDNNGEDRLSIHATDPESDIDVKVKTHFKDLSADKADIKSSTQDNLNIGGVKLIKNADDGLEFTSENDKSVIFRAPVEFENIVTQPGSVVNLSEVKGDELTVGNIKIRKDGDNTRVVVVDPAIESVFDIDAKSNIKDTTIEKGVIKSGVIESIKIGDSQLSGDTEGNILIEPEDAVNNLIKISTKTKIENAEIDTLTSSLDIHANRLDYAFSKVGKVRLLKDANENLEVNSDDDAKVIFKAPVELDNASIKNIVVEGGELKGTSVTGMKVGAISFDKEENSDSLLVTRTDTESKYKIKVPTEVTNITSEVLTSEHSRLTNIDTDQIKMGGIRASVTAEKDLRFANADLNDPKKIIFNADLEIDKATLKTFNTPLYRLLNKDKIELDTDNYLMNNNNRITFVNNKAIDIIGSDKASGIQFKSDILGNYSAKQYISSNAGAKAVETERNYFFETDTSNGIYFIKNTASKVSVNGSLYGFNDPTAQRNVSDLTKWFRSDLFIGRLEATSANLKPSDETGRNGLTIGTTRLSSIGPGNDCPEGLTVLESGDSIHLVQPMADNSNGCRDLSYQEVNTGALNVKGGVSVEGSLTLSEDFVTNGTIAASNLAITDDTEVGDLTVTGALRVSESAVFNSEVEFKNPLSFRNEVKSDSNFTAKSFISTGNSEFQRDIEVTRDINLGRHLAVGGDIVARSSIKSDSVIIGRSMETQKLISGDAQLHGTLDVNREFSVSGVSQFKNDVRIEGSVEATAKLNVKDSITAENIYAIREVYSRGKLTAMDGADIKGNTIVVGDSTSVVTFNGKMQFHTDEVSFNCKFTVYDTFKVAGETELNGKVVVNNGIFIDGSTQVTGNLQVDSGAKFEGDIRGRSLELEQSLQVRASVLANNITAQSIVIDNNATVNNITITGSLNTNATTRLNAGEANLSSIMTTNATSDNSFAGKIVATNGLECLKPLAVADQLTVGTDSVVINNSGIFARGAIESASLKTKNIEGTHIISVPAILSASNHRTAVSLTRSLDTRKFVRVNNFAVDGIAVFSSPLVVDTIMFRDMVFLEDTSKSEKINGVDIIARRAYYA